MTLAGFPRISVDSAVCGGRPVIAGTRLRVTDVLEALAAGATPAELVEDFPYLTEQDVRAGRLIELEVDETVTDAALDEMCQKLLANMVIENYRVERISA